jgi:hypothetical protein
MLRIVDNQTYFPRPVRDEMLVENTIFIISHITQESIFGRPARHDMIVPQGQLIGKSGRCFLVNHVWLPLRS